MKTLSHVFASSVGVVILLVAVSPTNAALDYVAINQGKLSKTHIFKYDTASPTTLTLVTTVNWNILQGGNTGTRVSAGPDGSFWTGASGKSTLEGVERWVPDSTASPTAWSADFAIDIKGETGANEYFDSSVRGAFNSDGVNPGGAELSDGTFMVGDCRSSSYGIGNRSDAWSGTVTAAFVADSQHLNVLSSSLGSISATNSVDVASTVAGSSNRFILTSNENDVALMVYNADGTKKGDLTNLSASGSLSGVGTMKTAGMGDVVLQLASNRSLGPTGKIQGHSVADANFDSVVLSQFSVTGAPWIEFSDVDGTESGLIAVIGGTRRGGIGDSVAVQFFNTDGTAHSSLFHLRDISSDFVIPTASSGASVAGLYLVPEPATMGLLALGFAGLAALRRRKR